VKTLIPSVHFKPEVNIHPNLQDGKDHPRQDRKIKLKEENHTQSLGDQQGPKNNRVEEKQSLCRSLLSEGRPPHSSFCLRPYFSLLTVTLRGWRYSSSGRALA
jgi:hypothetical protein